MFASEEAAKEVEVSETNRRVLVRVVISQIRLPVHLIAIAQLLSLSNLVTLPDLYFYRRLWAVASIVIWFWVLFELYRVWFRSPVAGDVGFNSSYLCPHNLMWARTKIPGRRGLFLESPEHFSGHKSQLSNWNALVLKSWSLVVAYCNTPNFKESNLLAENATSQPLFDPPLS